MREEPGIGISTIDGAPILRQRAREERDRSVRAASARVRVVRAEMASHYDAAAMLLEAEPVPEMGSQRRRLLAWARRLLRAKSAGHDSLHRQ
ncbi:hypothetical protein ABS767_17530 [Sphingomonas sp. ST-64]|uniref:Uncharacterized protein n=1 Tax=Sphingomonas plantiphila TaxID=3163295 RepID=A0ABW8YUD7_9SPHN